MNHKPTDYKIIHNQLIKVEMLQNLTNITYLTFENCTFYNVFHHIYDLTKLKTLRLINCSISRDKELDEIINMLPCVDITDSIIKLVNLKELIINTQYPINISKKLFEMNLTSIAIGENIITSVDVCYYNLMNYNSFYINYLKKNKKTNRPDTKSIQYQHENTMLITINSTNDNIINIPEHITKLNIIFTSHNISNEYSQSLFDNLPTNLLELKIINPNHELSLTNLPSTLEKIYFFWTLYTKNWLNDMRTKIFDKIISNSKIPFSTELINL